MWDVMLNSCFKNNNLCLDKVGKLERLIGEYFVVLGDWSLYLHGDCKVKHYMGRYVRMGLSRPHYLFSHNIFMINW